MNFKRLLIGVLMMTFVLGGSIQAVNFLKMEFGGEAVYAKDDQGQHKGQDKGEHGDGNKNPTQVPEPSTLVLMGVGLAAAGSYMVIRLKKSPPKK